MSEPRKCSTDFLPSARSSGNWHRLRQQRQPEVEVEDVRLRREPGERAPLRQLPSSETAAAPEVDVGLRVQPVAVEDDEPRVDAASPERLDVRPRDAGGVDGAVRDAHEATLPRELLRLCDQLVERCPPAGLDELGRALGSERLAQRLERPLVLGDLLLRDLHRDRLEGAGGPTDETRSLLRLLHSQRQLARGAEQVRKEHPVVEPDAERERLAQRRARSVILPEGEPDPSEVREGDRRPIEVAVSALDLDRLFAVDRSGSRVTSRRGDRGEVRERDGLTPEVAEALEDRDRLRVQLDGTIEVAVVDGSVAELCDAARDLVLVAEVAESRERRRPAGRRLFAARRGAR